MNYLLDTNICIYVINRKPAAVLKKVLARQPGQIAISTITVAELEYGVARSRYPDHNLLALLEFLMPFTILDFDQKSAMEYGRIRSSQQSRGKPVGPMDLLLAAQARAHNLILVTNDEREFARIEGMRIENWAQP